MRLPRMGIDLCEWRALREWRRLRAIFLLFACLAHAAWGEESIRFLVQSSPLAGSQFHALARLAKDMRVGDALTLRREPDNRYDANAVRVEWKGEMLGYVPRRENRAVAAALERGEPLSARISRLDPEAADPWQRMEFEVWITL